MQKPIQVLNLDTVLFLWSMSVKKLQVNFFLCLTHLVIFLVFKDEHLTQLIGNILQVKERGATTIIVTNLPKISDVIDIKKIDFLVQLPSNESLLAGLIAVAPLQILCYYTAIEKGINPDKQIFDAIDFEQTAISASYDCVEKW